MAPTIKDNAVTETMSRGVSHKAVALLDKRSDDEKSLQRVSMWQLSVLKLGVMVIMDVPELKRPWSAENHSNVSQISGVALMNGQKDLPVCDTSLDSIRIVKYVGKIT